MAKKKKILFVDDVREPPYPGMTVARSVIQALTALRVQRGKWDEVWLDYDLGGGDTADSIVTYLEIRIQDGRPVLIDKVIVHSWNGPGAKVLMQSLSKHYNVERAPFALLA